MRRVTEASLRFEERRRRENEAQRLHDRVPDLDSLRLEVAERRGHVVAAETKHARPIVVASAPALFVVPCGDSTCRDGGHDLTEAILRGLLAHQTSFEVDDACSGTVGTVPCDRQLHVVVLATYR